MNEIIVGVDDSATAKKAAVRAAALAGSSGRPLHIVVAVPPRSYVEVRSAGSQRWQLDSISMADQTVRALAGNVRCATQVTYTVIADKPAKALCAEAVRLNASMIAVGSKRGQGVARMLGSIAGRVTKHAPCDVLIVRTT
jgi:nucleotide-binding universal stress UspA family protein